MKDIGKWLMLSVVWITVGGLSYVALDMTGSPWVMCAMIIPFLITTNLQKRR